MSTNGAMINEQEVDRATQADLKFQERLEGHSKQALIFLIDQLTCEDRINRGWMLKYLEGVEELLPGPGADSLQDRILQSIKNERLAQDCQRGPVAVRPRTMNEWTDLLVQLTLKASKKAGSGHTHQVLKGILEIASEAVAALEDRIDAEAERGKDLLAEAIKQVTVTSQSPKEDFDTDGACNGPTGNKKADAAETAPAESESLNNQ